MKRPILGGERGWCDGAAGGGVVGGDGRWNRG